MRSIGLVVVLMLAACTSGPPVAGVSPTPQASATSSPAVASPTPQASPSASPSAEPSPIQTNLHCRLPVTWLVQDGQTSTSKAGFLIFPGQTLLEDRSAPATGAFYDRAFSKWLPVQRTAVSPDGRRYAYGEGNPYLNNGGKVHVVDLVTGVDRVIYSGKAVYAVVEFAADGLYLTGAAPEGYPRGLYLMDPAGGPARVISSGIIAPAVGGGAAWGIDFNSADPSPGIGGIEGPKNEILRFDLKSGTATRWFYQPGSTLYVAGFDSAGHPFVTAFYPPAPTDSSGRPITEVLLLRSAMSATKVFSWTGGEAPARLGAIDSHGVWFDGSYTSNGTVWLYTGALMKMVAAVNARYLAVAGGCIP